MQHARSQVLLECLTSPEMKWIYALADSAFRYPSHQEILFLTRCWTTSFSPYRTSSPSSQFCSRMSAISTAGSHRVGMSQRCFCRNIFLHSSCCLDFVGTLILPALSLLKSHWCDLAFQKRKNVPWELTGVNVYVCTDKIEVWLVQNFWKHLKLQRSKMAYGKLSNGLNPNHIKVHCQTIICKNNHDVFYLVQVLIKQGMRAYSHMILVWCFSKTVMHWPGLYLDYISLAWIKWRWKCTWVDIHMILACWYIRLSFSLRCRAQHRHQHVLKSAVSQRRKLLLKDTL